MRLHVTFIIISPYVRASTRATREIRACMLSPSRVFQIYETIPFITIKETEKKEQSYVTTGPDVREIAADPHARSRSSLRAVFAHGVSKSTTMRESKE